MRRLFLLLLCGVVGCRTATPVAELTVPHLPTIRLWGHEIPPEEAAIQAEVRQHISPGLPAETAHARMEECGFHCLYGGMSAKMPKAYHPNRSLPELLIGRDARKDKRFHTLVCTLFRAETGNWGRRCFPLTVLLPYDENGLITEVEVPKIWPHDSYCAGFFARRPDLREPVGLPVEQARALMQAQHFQCADAPPDGRSGDSRPFLSCWAYDETPLGGKIIRVHLFYDETRTVTEVEVVQKPGPFDDLLCMLPNHGDTVGEGVFKGVVFPARLYTAVVVDGLLGWLAVNGGH